jgi:hypothetical protein
MDPIFTLQYAEYVVAETLAKLLSKRKGYSISIPLSRQQKGFDLLVYSSQSGKVARVQIKASRSYPGKPAKRESTNPRFQNNLWFNNFKCEPNTADFYVLLGLFSKTDLDRGLKKKKWIGRKMLIFTEKEMQTFLKSIRTKAGKRDRFFAFGFDSDSERVFLTRGTTSPKPFDKFLVERRLAALKRFLH